MAAHDPFDLKFTSREVTAWGCLALLKRMLDALDFKAALQDLKLPQPGSNRGYAPEQLIEQIDSSAFGAGLLALRMPTSHGWMQRWCACLTGARRQATKPSCGGFSALTKAVPRGCSPAATAGCLAS